MTELAPIFMRESVDHSQLSKKEGYRIHQEWLEIFAEELKNSRGKFAIGNYIWESYLSGVLPSTDGDGAIEIYSMKPIEEYYVICDSGEIVFKCKSDHWPNLFGKEAIVFPKSKLWSLVYSHEETVHYVEP